MPRDGYLSVEGFDPATKGSREFLVSKKQAEHLFKFGPTHRYYELQSVAEVLKSPLVIFQGLKREGKETAFCYVGKPQRHGEDWSGPGPNGMVFMVCVTVDGVVFEWRWEKENKVDGNRPKDIKQRFENEIWKH